jgi:hypothetical protein
MSRGGHSMMRSSCSCLFACRFNWRNLFLLRISSDLRLDQEPSSLHLAHWVAYKEPIR